MPTSARLVCAILNSIDSVALTTATNALSREITLGNPGIAIDYTRVLRDSSPVLRLKPWFRSDGERSVAILELPFCVEEALNLEIRINPENASQEPSDGMEALTQAHAQRFLKGMRVPDAGVSAWGRPAGAE